MPRTASEASVSGSKSSGGSKGTLNVVAELQKIIDNPNVPQENKNQAIRAAGLQKNSGKGSGPWGKIGKALDIVDTPRAFVVSGTNELFDLTSEAFKMKGHEYSRVSWDELWANTSRNMGAGDMFYEQSLNQAKAGEDNIFGIKIFDDAEMEKLKADPTYRPKLSRWGRDLGIASGLTLDIGLDPLTYLAPEEKLVAAGGAKAVGRRLMGVADDPEAWRIGQKILRESGIGGLSRAELAKVNQLTDLALEGGVHMNVPGTGRVIRGGLEAVGLGKIAPEARQIRIAGQEVKNLMPGSLAKKALGAGKRTVLAGHLAEAFGGDVGRLWNKVKTGTPQEAYDAFQAADNLEERRMAAKVTGQKLEHEFVKTRLEIDAASKATGLDVDVEIQRVLDMDDAARAADPAVQKIEAAAPGLVSRVRAFTKYTRAQLNDLAEREFIADNPFWRPSISTDDWKALLVDLGRKPGKGGGTNPAWFERKALRPGDEFIGELIEEPSKVGMGIHEQMLKIIQDKSEQLGWKTVENMFEPSFTKAMESYIKSGLHRATMVAVEDRLSKLGIAVDRFATVTDKASVQTLQRRRRAVKAVWDARLAEKRKRAVYQQAQQDLADAQALETATAVGGAQAKVSAKKAVDSATRKAEAAADSVRYTVLAAEGAEAESRRVSREGVKRALERIDVFDEAAGKVVADAKRALQESADEIEKLQGARNNLLQLRERAVEKLAAAQERLDDKVAKIGSVGDLQDGINKIEDTIAALEAKIAARGLAPDHAERVAALTHQIRRNDTVVKMIEDFLAKSSLPSNVTGLSPDDLAAMAKKIGTDWPTKNVPAQKRVRAELQKILDQKARPLVSAQREQLRQMQLIERVHGEALRSITGQRDDLLRTLDGKRAELDAIIASLGDDPAAAPYIRARQQLSQVDGKGYLLNPNEPGGEWYHVVGSGHEQLDLSLSSGDLVGRRVTAEPDTYGLPPHFSQHSEIGGFDGGNDLSSPNKVGVVRLRADNPIVYGFDPVGVNGESSYGVLRTLSHDRQINSIVPEGLTGYYFSEGKAELMKDMATRALRNEDVTPQELLRYLGEDGDPFTDDVLDAVNELYDDLILQGHDPLEAMLISLRNSDTGWDTHALKQRREAVTRRLDFAEDEYAAAFDALPLDHPLREGIADIGETFDLLRGKDRHALNQVKWDILEAHRAQGTLDNHFTMWAGNGEFTTQQVLDAALSDDDFLLNRMVQNIFLDDDDMMSRLFGGARNQAVPDELLERMGNSYRQSLEAEGYDAIIYHSTVADDYHNAIPLNNAQVEKLRGQELEDYIRNRYGDAYEMMGRAAGPDAVEREVAKETDRVGALVKDVRDIMDENYAKLGHEVSQYRELVKKLEGQLAEPIDYRAAYHQWYDNVRELDRLQRQIGDIRTGLVGDLDATLAEEFGWRQHADTLWDEASTLMKDYEEAEIERLNKLAGVGQVIEDADKASKQAAAYTLRLHAQAAKAEADLLKAGKKRMKAEAALGRLKRPENLTKVEALLIPNNMSKLGWDKMAPSYIVDALNNSGKMLSEPGWLRGPLKHYDRFMSTWKGWQLATPGFHFRNTFGGVFNNWLYGIDMGRYRQYRRLAGPYYRALRQGADEEAARLAMRKAAKGQEAVWFEQILDSGIMTGGQSTDVIVRQGERMTLNPFSTNNPMTRMSTVGADLGKTGRHIPGGRDVENFLRGSMALDVMARGGDIRSAVDNVLKYHFDYEDLSRFERSVMKRVFPFYTWTRKNLPLQIEGLLENPKAYTRMMTVKRNMEVGIDTDEIVPSWFNDTITMDTGFNDRNGSSIYWMPDLPYKDINKTTDIRHILSQTGPLIKTPIEMWAGKKFFQDIPFKDGYYRSPSSWEKLGIPQILSKLPLRPMAYKGSDGHWYMSDKDSYFVEQFVPLLGRARRTFPSAENRAGENKEGKFEQRHLTFLISMNLGIGLRANTPADQEIELWRRTKELEKQRKLLQDLGYIERKPVAS